MAGLFSNICPAESYLGAYVLSREANKDNKAALRSVLLREYIRATHSFHFARSYFLTSSSVSLEAMYLRISVMKLSVVYVKNVFNVPLKVF